MNIDKNALTLKARNVYFKPGGTMAEVVDTVLAEVAKHNAPDKPAYYKTSERKPGVSDCTHGKILGWMQQNSTMQWTETNWDFVVLHPSLCKYWMPMPPAPVSEDEAAFGCILRDGPPSALGVDKHAFHGMDVRALRYVWDAALAHREKTKP